MLLFQPTNLLEIKRDCKAKGDIILFVNDKFFIHIKILKTSLKVRKKLKSQYQDINVICKQSMHFEI